MPVFWQAPSFSQSSTEPGVANAVPEIQQPQEAAPDLNELIAYRFRLGAADASYSLVVVNKTAQPGRFLYRGLTRELESIPQNTSPARVDPGQTITVPATDLRWPNFECLYVEASRHVELRLARDGESDGLAIPLIGRETLYDVLSEQRLGEIEFSEFDQIVTWLGTKSALPFVLKADENLRATVRRLSEKVQPTGAKIFLVTPLKSSSRGSTK